MKLKVTRLIRPELNQRRYKVSYPPYKASGDILPDLLQPFPLWIFHTVDRAFTQIRDARPWSPEHESVTITIEIK